MKLLFSVFHRHRVHGQVVDALGPLLGRVDVLEPEGQVGKQQHVHDHQGAEQEKLSGLKTIQTLIIIFAYFKMMKNCY